MPAPVSAPPIRLESAEKRTSPRELGIAAVPEILVPIKFPVILLFAVVPCTEIPAVVFPEIIFRDDAVDPPIKLELVLLTFIPMELGRANFPVTSTPIKLFNIQ